MDEERETALIGYLEARKKFQEVRETLFFSARPVRLIERLLLYFFFLLGKQKGEAPANIQLKVRARARARPRARRA